MSKIQKVRIVGKGQPKRPYLTKGKEYEVVDCYPPHLYSIIDDEGDYISILVNHEEFGCSFLDDTGLKWELVE